MLPFNEAKWFLGYSNLAMIMEQDRRHWLLKTDRTKQIQDVNTGMIFQGNIDNKGSNINITTEKLSTLHVVLSDKLNEPFTSILQLESSSLPFSYSVNGLSCARIISTEFPYSSSPSAQSINKNYKIRFEDCEVVRIPFPGMNDLMFGFQFIKTSTNPILNMMDSGGNYTIQVPITNGLTNCVYYYPLDTFQPIDITDLGDGVYETVLINDDSFIGYPAFWFTCDETNVGPKFYTDGSVQEFSYGNYINDSYNVNMYIMNHTYTNNFKLRVYPASGYSFNGTDSDFSVPLDVDRVALVNTDDQPVSETNIPFTYDSEVKLFMQNPGNPVTWEYYYGYYEVYLSEFNGNYTFQNVPLLPVLKLILDNNIPFEGVTNDTGSAGVVITSDGSDYPYNLNQWDGLPSYLTSNDDSKQRMVVYAIHNTPNTTSDPTTRQTAGLILDPGKDIEDPEEEELTNDERGRVYVLSNDPAEYVNNAIAKNKKPERTLARICDIPISVMQLANVSGIAPTPIVDPKYVRSLASYTGEEKNRLYNVLSDKWVKPIHLDENGVSIIDRFERQTNEYVFEMESYLRCVDLFVHNDFREYIQLNEVVHPNEVTLYQIADPGEGYVLNDIGVIVIGGFAYNYVVQEVDSNGGVMQLGIAPGGNYDINIANFDMLEGQSGVTRVYGTSPQGSTIGTGLKLQFLISNYTSKIPTRGNVYDGLYAFCKSNDGIWLYSYNVSSHTWNKTIKVVEYEVTSDRVLSTKDSYIHSILPNINTLPVAYKNSGVSDTTLRVISTSSFVNIVDDTKTPVYDPSDVSKPLIDFNKFYCNRIYTGLANRKDFSDVLFYIKNINNGRFDSYLIWRWVDENDPRNRNFEYGIIHRSFNNLQSTNTVSYLPDNDLLYKNYVHTNTSTTISWNIDNIGSMIWTFNPNANVYESYIIDPNTRELKVDRKRLTWDMVEVYTDNYQTKIDLVDSDGILQWNIASNIMRYSGNIIARVPIYQQPDYTNELSKGSSIYGIQTQYNPLGSWQLIFPRVQSFTFKNNQNISYTSMKMNILRNPDLQDTTDVLDSNNKPVNYKTIVLKTNDDTTSLNVYNSETGKWEKI